MTDASCACCRTFANFTPVNGFAVQYGWDQFDAYDRIAKPHMTRYGIRLLDLDPLHYRVEARGLALAALAMVSPSVAGTTARRLTST